MTRGITIRNESLRYHWLLPVLLLVPLSADAIRVDCTDGLTSELPVKVKIEIPAFLYFQVGSENQVAEVAFDVTPELPTQGAYTGDIPPALATGGITPSGISGSDVNNGVNVKVRSNCGQVKLSYSVSDSQGMQNATGYHIPFGTLQTTSSDVGLPAPVLDNAAASEVMVATTAYGAVTDRSAIWQYRYDNTTMPAAGIYRGTVTYQASCL
ncbi:MAG: hypothetical protein ACPGVP_14800 [Thiolinea sp.]